MDLAVAVVLVGERERRSSIDLRHPLERGVLSEFSRCSFVDFGRRAVPDEDDERRFGVPPCRVAEQLIDRLFERRRRLSTTCTRR